MMRDETLTNGQIKSFTFCLGSVLICDQDAKIPKLTERDLEGAVNLLLVEGHRETRTSPRLFQEITSINTTNRIKDNEQC